jgi:hypothetical protein
MFLLQSVIAWKQTTINAYMKKARQKNSVTSQLSVTNTYNPNYSGGRDQEDCSSKPAGVNSSLDPISKIPNTKNDW